MNLQTRGAGVAQWREHLHVARVHFKSRHRPQTWVEFRIVKSSQLPAKIAAYLVRMGRLLCLAILYGWHFLKITQPSTSKLSDNPVNLLLVLPELFLLREVFLLVLWFSPLLKNQHFQIPVHPKWQAKNPLMWMCYL